MAFMLNDAQAQYENIRKPLTKQDHEMISRYHLKSMKLFYGRDSLTHSEEYDEKGNILRTFSDGVYYSYSYDQEGNTTRLIDSFKDKDSKYMYRDTFLFEYDTNGFLKSAKLDRNTSVFIYDSASSTLVEQAKDTSWPERLINTYTYNLNKDIIEQHIQDPLHGTVTTEKVTYFPDHQVSTDAVYVMYKNGEIDSAISSYLYNAHGKMVHETTKSVRFYSGKPETVHISTQDFYDDKDRLLEEFVNEDGVEKKRFVFSYKGNGLEPVSESYFNKGILQRVDSYELDPVSGLPLTLTEDENGAVTKYRYEYARW
jgi:hypothetical protein